MWYFLKKLISYVTLLKVQVDLNYIPRDSFVVMVPYIDAFGEVWFKVNRFAWKRTSSHEYLIAIFSEEES